MRGDKAAASFHPPLIPHLHVTYPWHVASLSHGRFSSCPLPIVNLTLRTATSPRLIATPFPPLRRTVNREDLSYKRVSIRLALTYAARVEIRRVASIFSFLFPDYSSFCPPALNLDRSTRAHLVSDST